MEYHDLRILLEMPATRLLRSANAAMALGFFYRAFKQQHRVAIPEGQARAILENYLDELRESEPNAFPQSAHEYLADWCNDTHGFIRKYYGEDREPIVELSAGTEKSYYGSKQFAALSLLARNRGLRPFLTDSTPS